MSNMKLFKIEGLIMRIPLKSATVTAFAAPRNLLDGRDTQIIKMTKFIK